MTTLPIDTADSENWSKGDVDLLWDELLDYDEDEIEKSTGRARVRAYMRGGVMVREHGRQFDAADPKMPTMRQPHSKPGSATRRNEQDKVPVQGATKTPKRDDAWLKDFQSKSLKERDKIADPERAIKAAVEATCGKRNDGKYSNEPSKAVEQRLKELGHLTEEKSLLHAREGLTDLANTLMSLPGADKGKVKALVLDATDTLMAQEHEALGRTLGDHGIRHLLTDAHVGIDILAKAGDKSPESRAAMLIAGIYHDTGYLTKPSKQWADGDHPHWSQKHYDANVRPMIEATLGKPMGKEMSRIIATHAMTHMDWQGNVRASAFRLADNLGLFHSDKLPGFAYFVPKNTDVLVRLGKKEIDLDTAKAEIKKNIQAAPLKEPVRKQLLKAADEVNPTSPKFMIGMVGTKLAGIRWKGDHPEVRLKRTTANAELSKVLDLGQRQFKKFAETYLGEKAADQLNANDHLALKAGDKTLLEMDFKTAVKKMLEELRAQGLI